MIEMNFPEPIQATTGQNGTSSLASTADVLPLKDSSRYLGYRKLVSEVSDQLRKENALRLAYLYKLPAWYYEVGPTHDTAFALRVLIALEGKGVFSPESLGGLEEALRLVSREDLARLVVDFVPDSTTKPAWQSGRLNSLPHGSPLQRSVARRSLQGPIEASLLHSRSMTAIAASNTDDIEKDLVEETVYRSHNKLNVDNAVSSKPFDHNNSSNDLDYIGSAGRAGHQLRRTVSHEDFTLALGCVFTNATALLKQLRDISEQIGASSVPLPADSQQGPICSSTPGRTSVPSYLIEAISAAKQLARNLNNAVSLSSSPSACSTPVPEIDPCFDSRKFSRSSSGGRSKLSKHSSISSGICAMASPKTEKELMEAKRQLFISQTEDESALHPNVKLPLTAPQSENMHGASPTAPSSGSLLRRRKSKREVRQFSRKGLLFWQIKVKSLRKWLTQRDAKVESEDFYDHHKRTFKASLHPFGLSDDEGKYMTLAINYLEEPRSKELPISKIVVNLLDPQSSTIVIPPIERSIERRGVRFVQQFVSHAKVNQFSPTGVIVITIAIVSESTDDDI